MSAERRRTVNRYDLVASVFEATTYAVSLGLAPSVYRGVSDLLRVPRDSTVLEVGCGPASLTPYLLESTDDDTLIVGIDVAPRLVAKAQSKSHRHGWARVQFECADFDAYEPASPPAAIVFCLALSAFPDPDRAIRRALSLLPGGGQLIVADSIPSWKQPCHWPASMYMHLKATFLGARPSADLLAIAQSQLVEKTERTIGRGLYTLFAGRKTAAS